MTTICVTRKLGSPLWSATYVEAVSPCNIPLDEEIVEVVSTETVYEVENRLALNLTRNIINGNIILPTLEQLGYTSGVVFTKYTDLGGIMHYAYMPIHLYLALLSVGQELELSLDVANYTHINDVLNKVKLMQLQINMLQKSLANSNYGVNIIL